jgi:hypothetical protein
MKRVETKLTLALTFLLASIGAIAGNSSGDVPRAYSASPAYWNWVDGMNFPAAQAEPAKAARPFTASDGYWVWMDSMKFSPVTAAQTAGRPYTANDAYWAWVDGMQFAGESNWVGTKAKAPAGAPKK